MPAIPASIQEARPSSILIRRPGHDFDRGGRRSTLGELLDMGGYFPLAQIVDRLPFPGRTLRRWARSPKGRGIFLAMDPMRGGRAPMLLVDLQGLEDCLRAMEAGRAWAPPPVRREVTPYRPWSRVPMSAQDTKANFKGGFVSG